MKLDLEDLADKIIRVEYPAYEQTTIPQMKSSIIRKKEIIKQILEQRIKQACKFYLRYFFNADKLVKEHPEYKKDVDKFFYDDIVAINGILFRSIDVVKLLEEQEKYNKWLFKLAFKDVLKEGIE